MPLALLAAMPPIIAASIEAGSGPIFLPSGASLRLAAAPIRKEADRQGTGEARSACGHCESAARRRAGDLRIGAHEDELEEAQVEVDAEVAADQAEHGVRGPSRRHNVPEDQELGDEA